MLHPCHWLSNQSYDHGALTGPMRRGVNSWRRAVGARAGGFADEVGDGRLPPASRLVEPHRIGISVDVGVGLQHDCALADTHAGQRRHGIEQRAEAPVGVQEAADEATFLAAAPMLQHRDAPGRRPVDVLDRHWSEAGFAGEHVLYAARENYDVTGFEGDRRHAAPAQRALPLRGDMERRQRFRRGTAGRPASPAARTVSPRDA